ncbi:MAG: hypothetical protein NUV31_08395 [Dehalococcoidales bacterium]|nr:hypothetical protein [Dehalococcoidales bacterium]
MFWHIIIFSITGIALLTLVYRVVSIARLPVHLRWELAPVPHDKTREKYGGSYLEEQEWWQKPIRKSIIKPLKYMAAEIIFLRGVWKNNQSLWPFSLCLHGGIYLLMCVLFLSMINALLIAGELAVKITDTLAEIISYMAVISFLVGSAGAISLVFKRLFDPGLKPFNTAGTFFNLLLLAAVFVTGAVCWFYQGEFGAILSLFISRLITLEIIQTVPLMFILYISISLLFILYLPVSSMAHFIIKYFLYHAVRWNDEPLNARMESGLRKLLAEKPRWSALIKEHENQKTWCEIGNGEISEK